MASWANIQDGNNRFRLLCDDSNCSLSLCNLLNGRLHITSIHGNARHSYTLTNDDMLFVVSQYINSLSEQDREKLLKFFQNF